ncbi:hypothetical protein ACFYYB_27260 [Streptomyces sp. NPDC002886]
MIMFVAKAVFPAVQERLDRAEAAVLAAHAAKPLVGALSAG